MSPPVTSALIDARYDFRCLGRSTLEIVQMRPIRFLWRAYELTYIALLERPNSDAASDRVLEAIEFWCFPIVELCQRCEIDGHWITLDFERVELASKALAALVKALAASP
jgi:hypothetical protein